MKKLTEYRDMLHRQPLLYHLLLIAATMLALALAAHFGMQAGTRHGARRNVPDFAGMPLAEAQEAARSHDLKIVVNDSLYVPAYDGGIVLDQLPEGGVEVKPGRAVYVTINSFRQKMVAVPYVAGRSLRQAKNMLEIAGLEIAQLIYRPDMATNYVLDEYFGRQRITETTRVEAEMGSGVTLYVGVQPGHNVTVVPQIIGLSLRDAKSRLWELGLNVGKVAFDDGINLLNQKDAHVYMQSPKAERHVVLGAKVDLQLTLDGQKVTARLRDAEEQAAEAFMERQRIAEEKAAAERENAGQPSAARDSNGFFD